MLVQMLFQILHKAQFQIAPVFGGLYFEKRLYLRDVLAFDGLFPSFCPFIMLICCLHTPPNRVSDSPYRNVERYLWATMCLCILAIMSVMIVGSVKKSGHTLNAYPCAAAWGKNGA